VEGYLAHRDEGATRSISHPRTLAVDSRRRPDVRSLHRLAAAGRVDDELGANDARVRHADRASVVSQLSKIRPLATVRASRRLPRGPRSGRRLVSVLFRGGDADAGQSPTEAARPGCEVGLAHHLGLEATPTPADERARIGDEGVPVPHEVAHRTHYLLGLQDPWLGAFLYSISPPTTAGDVGDPPLCPTRS